MKPIVIWSPAYTHLHGGVRALHRLKEELNQRQTPAVMHYETSDYDTPVIYPEIVPTNILNSPHPIYWLLNKAHYPEGTDTWAWETGMGQHPLLTVNIIENYWHDRGLPRKGIAWWTGKGTPQPHLIPNGAQEIHRGNHPNRIQLAEYVAGLEYLISFDPFTSLNIEAAISGTPVLIHTINNQWGREDFERHAWIRHGIAWHETELEIAREQVHKAADDYHRKTRHFSMRIDSFTEHLNK